MRGRIWRPRRRGSACCSSSPRIPRPSWPAALILDVNKASEELLGYPRLAMLGLDPIQMSPALQPSGTPSRTAAMAFLAEVKAGTRNRFEWTFLHASGREVPCDVAITQYLLGPQHIYHAVFRDLTEQKRAETERAALERQLFQAQKMESLGVLAGGIAHDFNNLLMGVLGHAGLALEQLNPLHPVSATWRQSRRRASGPRT